MERLVFSVVSIAGLSVVTSLCFIVIVDAKRYGVLLVLYALLYFLFFGCVVQAWNHACIFAAPEEWQDTIAICNAIVFGVVVFPSMFLSAHLADKRKEWDEEQMIERRRKKRDERQMIADRKKQNTH